MEDRVKALETFAIETRDRLARIETRLDYVATKEDVAGIKIEVQSAINSATTKFIGWMFGALAFFTAVVTAVKFLVH